MPTVAQSKLTPEQRTERARKAAHASHSTEAHIRALVARAPELTEGQKRQLAALLVSP